MIWFGNLCKGANCPLEDEVGAADEGYVPQKWTKQKQLRALKFIQNLETSILEADEYNQYQTVLSKMGKSYLIAGKAYLWPLSERRRRR